ncbi:MAG TPA: hypothetical protein VJ782_03800, partial [Aeromicrobium sp.]|nr:hypothetical protein [Aeromicrobium sp.]
MLLAAVLVDPFGEFLPDDDGFAYARSVQYLLHSGEYKLDAWSAANMPVQIYVAAGLSKVFGYSLDLLKLTTVGMLGVGLASFYGLARELRAARWTSFAATVALLASPLVLLLTFSFQSDVQFMGWLMLALFLYVRGIRQDSDRLVFLGSLAAACAIGTRQLGVAIIGGLMVAWVLARREDRPRLRTLLLAAVIPTVAAALQFRSGLQEPTFTQVARLYEQRVYLEQPPLLLAQEFVWRLAIVLQYVGISLLPALPLVVAAAAGYIQRSRPRAKRLFQLTILIGLALCASLLTGSPLTEPWPRSVHWPWPPLGLEWLLHTWLPPDLVLPIDLVGLALATVVGALGVAGLRALGPIRRHRPETILLASIPVIMFGLHLAYPQLNDTYILSFVPFALLLLVIQFRESATLRLAVPATGVALTVILIVSLMLRADFAAERTRWAAADRL